MADCRDDRADFELIGGSIPCADRHRPSTRCVVPDCSGHFGAEPDVRLDPVADHDVVEVLLEFGLLRVVLGPVITGLERIAVEVVPDVDAGSRVTVLEPRAADTGVLLDDRVRNSRLLKTDAGQNSGLAGADHEYREPGEIGCGRRHRHPTLVDAIEHEFLAQHRKVFGRHFLATQPVHHFLDVGVARSGRQNAAVVAVGTDDVERDIAGRGLFVGRHEPLNLVDDERVRFQGAADHREITGHVDTRQQQGGDAHILECRPDRVVVIVEWQPGMRIDCVAHRFPQGGWASNQPLRRL